ncbi:sensor histidine kinase [Stappia sp. BW2]|nr:sensor histidine kinase [Stappia sp. BW2]
MNAASGLQILVRKSLRRLTWHNASQSDEQLREYLILALLRSRTCVMLQDDLLNYLYITNLPHIWSAPVGDAPTDEEIFGAGIGRQLGEAKKVVLQTGQAAKLQVMTDSGQIFEVHIETIAGVKDVSQVLTTIVDITESSRREQALKDLLLEVSHRSKNLLAVIQSLATQSARYSGSLEQFIAEFQGRIFSLSNSQDLVTEADWFGVRLFDLARSQMLLFGARRVVPISTTGENPLLTPNAALYVGLGLHELIASTFSDSGLEGVGNISLTCKTILHRGRACLSINWTAGCAAAPEADEKTAGSVEEQHRSAFSALLLETVLPQSLSGSATFSVSAGSISYSLLFPKTDYNVRQEGREDMIWA